MTESEMLELAAKAAGIKPFMKCGPNNEAVPSWNPLADDGDAFGMAVSLGLDICLYGGFVSVSTEYGGAKFSELYINHDSRKAATRRAIVRAAAEIGRRMK